jgi:hypothetical protein
VQVTNLGVYLAVVGHDREPCVRTSSTDDRSGKRYQMAAARPTSAPAPVMTTLLRDAGYSREVSPGFRAVLGSPDSQTHARQLFSEINGTRSKIADDATAVAVPK